MVIGLGLLVCEAFAVSPCDPPPETIKVGDFGFGVQQAVIWNSTNDCPNTRFFRQYTLDNGVTWEYPQLLGTSTGILTNGVFVQWRKFFFYLAEDAVFLTRAIPYDDFIPPTAELTEGTLGYTLTFPDGDTCEVYPTAFAPDEEAPKAKKPKKNR